MGRGHSSEAVTVKRRIAKTRILNPDFRATEEEAEWFMFGGCYQLASGLHQNTGWPLAGCGWRREGEAEIPEHVFVITPDGHSLDILGVHPRGEHSDATIKDDWAEFDSEDIIMVTGDKEIELPENAVNEVLNRMLIL